MYSLRQANMNSHPHKILMNRPSEPTRERSRLTRLAALFMTLACTVGLVSTASANNIDKGASATNFEPVSAALIAENCVPNNNAIDPGETDTVTFVIKNKSGAAISNVRVSLNADPANGPTFVSGSQVVGDMAKDASASVTFTFLNVMACNGKATMTLAIKSGTAFATDQGTVTFTSLVGVITGTPHTFSNTASIAIKDTRDSSPNVGPPTPAGTYPSKITVSNVPDSRSDNGYGHFGYKVSATLKGVTHGAADDIDAVLVSPTGKAIKLMSDSGFFAVNNANLTFDQAAGSGLPIEASTDLVVSGTFTPADYGTDDESAFNPDFTAPLLTSLEGYRGTTGSKSDVNGDWKLFVRDDTGNNKNGTIANGWEITITAYSTVCCSSGTPTIALNANGNSIANRTGDAKEIEDTSDPAPPVLADDPSGTLVQDVFVNSSDTADDKLVVSAFSSDETKIANSSFKVTSINANERRVKFRLSPNANGNVTVTLRVDDPVTGKSASTSFNIEIDPRNDNPTIVKPGNQHQNFGVSTPQLPFTVGDFESDPALLVVTAAAYTDSAAMSSLSDLVPANNIFLGGFGANRTIQVQPASDASGIAFVRITATDPDGGTTSVIWTVSFDTAVGKPTINPLDTITIEEDKTASIPVTIGDVQTAASDLTLAVTITVNPGSPSDLLAVSISGSGATRTLNITAKSNQSGSGKILLTAKDANNNQTTTETKFTVTPVNDKPVVTVTPTIVINEGNDTGDITITVNDVEDDSGAALGVATVVATSSNGTLFPLTAPAVNFPASNVGTANKKTWKVKLTPAADRFGTDLVTITATDNNGATGSITIDVAVVPVNDGPTFGNITDPATSPSPTRTDPANNVLTETNKLLIKEDLNGNSPNPYLVTVSDINVGPFETGQTITVVATSSDTSIVPNPEVAYTSPALTASLKIKPAENKNGEVTITVTVTDNGGTANGGVNSATKKFKIVVAPVNDAPTLSDIATQFAGPGDTLILPFTFADIDSDVSAGSFAVSAAAASNPTLLKTLLAPATNPSVTGAGGSRFVVVQITDPLPAPLPSPLEVTINYTANDGAAPIAGTLTKSFKITISPTPQNKVPSILYAGGDKTVDEDTIIANIGPFTVSDAAGETAAGSLGVVGRSSNQAVIKDQNIVVTSDGAGTRTFTIIPESNANTDASGPVTITVTVTDGGDALGFNKRAADVKFKVAINGIPDQPVVTAPADPTISVEEDKVSGEKEFTASDAETAPANLKFIVTSSDENIIPKGNVTISGPLDPPSKRKVTVQSKANANGGPVTIAIRAEDEIGLSAAFTIAVTVTPVNDAPTINDIAAQSFLQVTADVVRDIALAGIGDVESGVAVTVSATSNNTGLIPAPANPTVASDGKATLKLTQIANKSGSAEIEVSVTDGTATTKKKFTFAVGQVNQPPTITAIADQPIDQGKTTGIVAITVDDGPGDGKTPAANLILAVSVSDTTLFPGGSIVLGGSGMSRSIVATPDPTKFGEATITVTVTDTGTSAGADVKSASRTFLVKVARVEQSPVIGPIADITTNINEETEIISFTVTDQETPAGDISIAAVGSSNPTLIPVANVQFGGSGGIRLSIIVPAKDQFGVSTITIRATDGANRTGDRSFKVTVRKPNNPPTITAIANQKIQQGGSTGALATTVGDVETASGFLDLSFTSSNTSLVPVGNITKGGSKAARTATVTPVATESGVAVITVTVSDADGGKASTSFVLTVEGEVDNPPTISAIADQTTQQDSPTGVITFTVDDDKTAKGFLTYEKASSNTALAPVDGIILAGSGGNRTVFIIPAIAQSGTANITITVKDGKNQSASTTFKLTVIKAITAIPNDFDGDGKPDLLLQDGGAFLGVWHMNGNENLINAGYLTPNNSGDINWRLASTGDFNEDGITDLVFQHTDSTVAIWYMDGETLVSPTLTDPSSPGEGWKVSAAADFNGDGKSDLLFQNTNGDLAVWYMDGVSLTSPTFVNPVNAGDGFKVVAAVDVNSDGNTDIVFQHTDGTLAAWKLDGIDTSSFVLLEPSNSGIEWRLVSAVDLNLDGSVDFVFQNTNDRTLAVWFMNGTTLLESKYLSPSSAGGTWNVVDP